MKIDKINISIFHRKNSTEIKASLHNDHSYNLGEKEIDDNFKINFKSISDQNFLVFHDNKDGHCEHIEESARGKVKAEISAHRKLLLVIIKSGGIAHQYNLEIKHENHQSLFYFQEMKEIKIFLHSNGLPDSKEIDRRKNHILLQTIFSQMNESEIEQI